MSAPLTQEEIYWNILCLIYREIGRDCANLPKPSTQAAKAVQKAYEDERLLNFTNEEKAVFLNNLDILETLLKSAQSPVDQSGTEALFEFIALARQDLAT